MLYRDKWFEEFRRKIGALSQECESYAATEGSCMSQPERYELQELLRQAMYYIDNHFYGAQNN